MSGINPKRALTNDEIQLFLDNWSDDEDSDNSEDPDYIFSSQLSNDSFSNSESDSEEIIQTPRSPTPPLPPLPIPLLQHNLADGNFIPRLEWKKDIELPIPFPFTGNPGLKVNILDESNILDFVKVFLSHDFMSKIVEQTNLYAQQLRETLLRTNKMKKKSLMASWKETNIDELYVYFSLVFLMGVIKKPTLQMYWSQNFFINTPVFSTIMSRYRFLQHRLCVHFSNNIETQNDDKIYKIRPVVEHFIKTFQESYIPNSQICIDEILEKWKGRLSWRQFIPSKRARFGMKLFLLCEVGTNYTWNIIIYTGKGTELKMQTPIPEINQDALCQPTNIVLCLAEKLLGQGYTITCDNWYGSPELCYVLMKLKTDTYGTAKANRDNMPKTFKTTDPKIHEPIILQSDKIVIMRWRDPYKIKKKIVTLISTIHDGIEMPTGTTTRTGEAKVKPILILDYNVTMGAVDAVSQMTDPYKSARKGHKWYRKLFEYLMDIALLNAYILFKIKNPNANMTHKQFIIKTVEDLIEKHFYGLKNRQTPPVQNLERLIGRHFIQMIPQTVFVKRPDKRCKVCYAQGIRKSTRYMCRDCDGIALCITPCFETYHTVKDYSNTISSDSSDE